MIHNASAGIALPPGKRLVFRPQDAALSSADGATLAGPITHREFLGATVRYGMRIGGSEILVDVPFHSGAELRSVGDVVGVALPPERMLYLPA